MMTDGGPASIWIVLVAPRLESAKALQEGLLTGLLPAGSPGQKQGRRTQTGFARFATNARMLASLSSSSSGESSLPSAKWRGSAGTSYFRTERLCAVLER